MTTKPSLPVRIARALGLILGLVFLLLAIALIYFSVTEYRPDDIEGVDTGGEHTETLSAGDELTVMTWNIGFGALGDNADFFMDGGTSVQPSDEARVRQNMSDIVADIDSIDPDIAFLQEVDRDSKRSYGMNQAEYLDAEFDMVSSFAANFKTEYVPYPMPPIGKVDSGIMTLSDYPVSDASRIQLPVPFDWPVSMFNLKRALLINRVDIEGSDKELVTINLHLEAYDDGDGKAAQSAELMRIVDEETAAGNYVIAGGDFNQIFPDVDPADYPIDPTIWQPGEFDERLQGDVQVLTDHSVPTCRSLDRPYEGENHQYYVIDGFLVSENIDVVDVRTEDLGFVASDHNPVVTTLRLR